MTDPAPGWLREQIDRSTRRLEQIPEWARPTLTRGTTMGSRCTVPAHGDPCRGLSPFPPECGRCGVMDDEDNPVEYHGDRPTHWWCQRCDHLPDRIVNAVFRPLVPDECPAQDCGDPDCTCDPQGFFGPSYQGDGSGSLQTEDGQEAEWRDTPFDSRPRYRAISFLFWHHGFWFSNHYGYCKLDLRHFPALGITAEGFGLRWECRVMLP